MVLEDKRVYQLVNVKGNTALDLSGTDEVSIIGWEKHDGSNQKWMLAQRDGGWFLRNLGTGSFLSYLDGVNGLRDGLNLVGSHKSRKWDIREEGANSGVFRIVVPGTPFNVDLSNHGDPKNGTPVELWGQWEGKNQLWRFVEL